MVYKRQDGDVVLARFFIHGDSEKAVRFIKRRGKFYQINDVKYYKPDYRMMSTGVTHIDTMVETDPLKIICLINAAMNATLNWKDHNDETYEIWINHYIYSDMFGVEKHD